MLLINIHLLCNVFFVNINIRSRSVTAEKSTLSNKQVKMKSVSAGIYQSGLKLKMFEK